MAEVGGENFTVIAEHEVAGNPNASVDFIDPVLAKEGKRLKQSKDSKGIGTLGAIYEVYSHSTYVWDSSTITEYNSGPRTNDKFLVSVALGQTKTLSQSLNISGTVTYSATVSGDIAKVINVGLTGSASGTIGYTYNTTTQYSGPSSPYNTRDYYGAIQFDTHSTKVKKYNYYKTYNGSIYTGLVSYYAGIITTDNVKKPKAITYSKDFTN
ncbi:hypothetical protein [Bacillus sp. FJAT-18017]|uniref:hypothetical protein n=1 Tax=Bacillus sp. FJAT-18017 TaxID=1705566 RepID=UPI0012E0C9E3|nr:hypothetical protein [Bacillus sp. FJAT-18017]